MRREKLCRLDASSNAKRSNTAVPEGDLFFAAKPRRSVDSLSPGGLFFSADLGEPEGVSPRIRQRDAIDPWADPLRLAWMAIWLRAKPAL